MILILTYTITLDSQPSNIVTIARGLAVVHAVDAIEPEDSKNMCVLSASEFNQAAPHSVCLKDEAR